MHFPVAHGYETPALLTQVLAVYIINLYTGAALSPRAYVLFGVSDKD